MNFYFLNFPETKILFDLFENQRIEANFVGGCVRDALLGVETEDFDIAINADIKKVFALLKKNNILCIPTSLKYNTILAIINDKKFEITSLRKDENYSGRHSSFQQVSSFQEDATRRDFTINALYVSRNSEILDFFNGYSDLINKRVIFIGNPEKRITEDYLRILRYFRFAAKYECYTSQYSAILKKHSENLNTLSIERIQQELFKILNFASYQKAILQIKNILSGFELFSQMNTEIVCQISEKISLELKLFLIFKTEILLKKLKLTRIQKRVINEFCKFQNESLIYCLYKKGVEFYKEIAIIKKYKFNQKFEELFHINTFPTFPLNFKDLNINTKHAGKKLMICEKWWVENNFSKTKQECINFIEKL